MLYTRQGLWDVAWTKLDEALSLVVEEAVGHNIPVQVTLQRYLGQLYACQGAYAQAYTHYFLAWILYSSRLDRQYLPAWDLQEELAKLACLQEETASALQDYQRIRDS